MVEIKCNICKNIMFSCKHFDKFLIKPNLIICKDCDSNGELIPALMAKYSLVQKQKKIKEKIKQEVVLPRQEVNQDIIFTLLLSQNVRRLINGFASLKDKILNQQPAMSKKVEGSVLRIMRKAQKQVTKIIVGQAEELSHLIQRQDQINQKSINKLKQFTMQVKNRIMQLKFEEGNGDEGPPIFQIQEMTQTISLLNKKVSFMNTKHQQISQLISNARNLMIFGIGNEEND